MAAVARRYFILIVDKKCRFLRLLGEVAKRVRAIVCEVILGYACEEYEMYD